MKSSIVIIALLCIPAFSQTPSPKEDLEPDPLLGCYDLDGRIQSAISDVAKNSNNPDVAGYAVYAAHAWKKDRLSVTFAPDTAKQVREKVVAIMVEWNDFSRVQFHATDAPFEKGDIRVSFRRDFGNYSQLGRLAGKLSTNSPTMNLETCIKWPVGSNEFKRVVLHEFGHALGFAHEHQHPIDDCSAEIDWDKAYAFYEKDQGWTRDMVDKNVQTIKARSGMLLSPEGDLRSVMRYYLAPPILREGKNSRCFSERTYDLSQGDKLGAERLYPKGVGFGASGRLRPLLKMQEGNAITSATKEVISEWAAFWSSP